MAVKKISELEAAVDVTASDLIQVVDVEDADMASSGTNKKCTAQLLANELGQLASITSTGSSASRKLVDRFADVVNIKDFGAVGNGSTDDTAAIQNWLSALSGQFDKIGYAPSGRYKHTQPIVWSNYRNLTIKGSGCQVGDGQYGTSFEFSGDNTNPLHISGGIKLISVLQVNFEGIAFINRTSGIDYHIVVGANDSPSLSSHNVTFNHCGFYNGGGIIVNQAGVLVHSSKFVKFVQCQADYRSPTFLRFGLDDFDLVADNTLMQGQAAMCTVDSCLIFGDIDIRNANGIDIKNNGFGERTIDTGGSSITTSGEERTVSISVVNNSFTQDKSTNTDLRPAIDTGSYAGGINTAPSSGWFICGNTFRDRGVGVNVAQGGVLISGNTFQMRTLRIAGSKGVVIESSVNPKSSVVIDSSNDFSMADLNGLTAIEDNRSLTQDNVVFNSELSTDLTVSSVGSYETILTGNTTRAMRGGKYRVSYHAVTRATSTGSGSYRFQLLIGGVEYGTYSRVNINNSESATTSCSKIIKLLATTDPATITFRVEQESGGGGGGALIRGGGSLGSTFVQIEEVS